MCIRDREITDCVLRILDAAGADLNYEVFNVGAAEYEAHGELIPKEGYASMKKTHILLKSPITTPVSYTHLKSQFLCRRSEKADAAFRTDQFFSSSYCQCRSQIMPIGTAVGSQTGIHQAQAV